MIVRSLKIRRFRGIEQLDIVFHRNVNVFVGENGAGKSSILDCLASMLSLEVLHASRKKEKLRLFSDLDIKMGSSQTEVQITVADETDTEHSWSITLDSHGKLNLWKNFSPKIINYDLEENKYLPLPVVVFYPVGRAVLNIPERIRNRHIFDTRLAAYEGALWGGSDFRLFFEWFREREDFVNEKKVYEDPNFGDHQLKSVREAITRLTGFQKLRIRRSPQRMLLEKDSIVLDVAQLSDGEKCLLAMVGDMAMRLALANPTREDPLNSEAVFLIDEIDLHLHPAWQRRILPELTKLFPNSQFIVSTHSTQILTHVRPESIFILRNAKDGIVMEQPEESYGQSQDALYEDIMGVDVRPQEIKDKISAMFAAIDSNDLAAAKQKLNALRREIGSDPDLVRADILIKRKGG